MEKNNINKRNAGINSEEAGRIQGGFAAKLSIIISLERIAAAQYSLNNNMPLSVPPVVNAFPG
jgi:hypothetical protein